MMKNRGEQLVVRTQEQDRIQRFLSRKDGGALLLGGDRGSGKTTLVKESVKASEKQRRRNSHWSIRWIVYLRLLTKSPYVLVNIPLIIITPSEETDINERYRSLLMRAMLLGMEADLLRRYSLFSKIDLPQRWWRSIGYLQKVSSLKSYSHYIKLTKTKTKTITGPGNINIIPSLADAVAAEVDLSDSSLEMKLRDLLDQYSKIHKFVFVFDELDKLPGSINLENLVLYLKNLFTETGVHAIFVTDELNLKRIMHKAKSNPPSEMTTLFADHVLVNNMTREEFEGTIESKIKNIPIDQKNILISALSISTRRSPNEFTKLLLRTGPVFDDIINNLKVELGKNRFERFGILQRVTDSVTDLYRKEINNPYYRRLLNQALDEAATILENHSTSYIDQTEPLMIFYTDDLFREEGLTEKLLDERIFQYMIDRKGSFPVKPQIITDIESLGEDQENSIKAAIGTLVLTLNKLNVLLLASTTHKDVLKIGSIAWGSSLTHKRLDRSLNQDIYNLTEDEMRILRKADIFNPAFRAVLNESFYRKEHLIHLSALDEFGLDGKYSLANSRPRWQILKKLVRSSGMDLGKAITAEINKSISPALPIDSHLKNTSTLTLPNGKRFQIITLFGNDTYPNYGDIDKQFIFKDTSSRTRIGRVNPKVKHFRMSKSWGNYDSSIREIVAWINTQS